MENLMFNKNETLQDFIHKNKQEIQEILCSDETDQPFDEMAYNLISKLVENLISSDHLIKELQAPIIPSIIENTILVPITGQLTAERFEAIRTKILNNLHNINTAIIDFTAINKKDIIDIGIESLSSQISQLNSSLHLMGVEVIYVGFSPEVIKGIVYGGVDVRHLNCQLSFRTALQYLMQKKDITFAGMPGK